MKLRVALGALGLLLPLALDGQPAHQPPRPNPPPGIPVSPPGQPVSPVVKPLRPLAITNRLVKPVVRPSPYSFMAGVGRQVITPPLPFWLTGYASRTHPATSVKSDLWAKALALQDGQGGRVVIVSAEVLNLPGELCDAVAGRLQQQHGLRRSQILFNATHTHAGPVVWPGLRVMFDLSNKEQARVEQYQRHLADLLTAAATQALTNLSLARLYSGYAKTNFAMNRRQPTPTGVRLGENSPGPVDHAVPVLQVLSPEGRLRAVLFGYACHNTTLGGDFCQVDGDYAGDAQRELESAYPGATALFLMLCGADQNPQPRGQYEHVEQHGHALATVVKQVLADDLRIVRPFIRTGYQVASLELAPHRREVFEAEANSDNRFKQRRAKLMLEAYAQRRPVREVPCPVQVIRFSRDLTLLALGGEVVVDYALRAKREFSRDNMIVAGYCNDVMAYLPSQRVLNEGGYEAVDNMIYYGLPGPFAENVEETVFRVIYQVMALTALEMRPR